MTLTEIATHTLIGVCAIFLHSWLTTLNQSNNARRMNTPTPTPADQNHARRAPGRWRRMLRAGCAGLGVFVISMEVASPEPVTRGDIVGLAILVFFTGFLFMTAALGWHTDALYDAPREK